VCREEEDDALSCESVCWAALVLVVGLVVDCGAGIHHGLLGQVSPGRFFFLSFLFCFFSYFNFVDLNSVLNSITFVELYYLKSNGVYPRPFKDCCYVLENLIWILKHLFIDYYWNLSIIL
jgi:hypothetical protein